jgi:hypothetical protein
MKTAMRNYGMLVAALLTFSTVTFANDGGNNNQVTELKVIGNIGNEPVFQLNLANTDEDEFTVTFRDELGNILYTDRFKGANISKKFMLKSEELSDAYVNVVVTSKKTNKSDVYIINRSATYVEETVVNKIK